MIVPMTDSRPTILVVEDEFWIALVVQSTLEAAGFRVLGPAHNVEAAMLCLEHDRPDAALMDVQLIGETSVPVAEALIERGVPFVVSSGVGSQIKAYPVFNGRSNMGKPVDPAELVTALRELIAER